MNALINLVQRHGLKAVTEELCRIAANKGDVRASAILGYAAGHLVPSADPWVCPECGSEEIQDTSWVDTNTGIPNDPCGEDDSVFCAACERHSDHYIPRSEWESTVEVEDPVAPPVPAQDRRPS